MAAEKTNGNTESERSGLEKSRRSPAKILARLLVLTFFALILFVGCLGAALQYFFPSRTVTPRAERELSRILNSPVRIERVDFSLLNGVKVKGIGLMNDPPLLGNGAAIFQ